MNRYTQGIIFLLLIMYTQGQVISPSTDRIVSSNIMRLLEGKTQKKADFRDQLFQNWDQIEDLNTLSKKIVLNVNFIKNVDQSSDEKVVNVNIGNLQFGNNPQSIGQSQDSFQTCPNNNWKGNPDFQSEKKRFIKINTKYGLKLYVDRFDDYVSKLIKNNGLWQPSNLYMAMKWVKPGDKILNLGSHIGLEIVFLGKIVGNKGKVFVFEPYSVSYHLLKKNLQINGLLDRTTTYRLGAHNNQSKSDLFISYKNTGGNSVVSLGWTDDIFKEKIQLKKVDNVLPEDIQLDFALIDVQRVEANALTGMKKVIQRSPKLVMIVEWQTQFNLPLAKEILNFLLNRGYKMYKYQPKPNIICQLGEFIEIKTIQELLSIKFVDLILVPKGVKLPK